MVYVVFSVVCIDIGGECHLFFIEKILIFHLLRRITLKKRRSRKSNKREIQFGEIERNGSINSVGKRNEMSCRSPIGLSNSIHKHQDFSTKSDQRFSMKRIHQNEKPIENGNKWMKSPIDNDKTSLHPLNQRNSVSVQRLRKSIDLNERYSLPLNKTPINEENNSKMKRYSQITVTKIPRNKRFSIDNQSLTIQHQIDNQTFSSNEKANSRKGINVTRIRRNETIN